MCLGKLKATHWALWPRGRGHYPLNLQSNIELLMLRLKLYLVDLRGNARYHVAIVTNEWLLAYLNTLICVVFLSLEATSHKLYIFNSKLKFGTITDWSGANKKEGQKKRIQKKKMPLQ